MHNWKTTAFAWTSLVIIAMVTIQDILNGKPVDVNALAEKVSLALGLIAAKDFNVSGTDKL